MTKQIMKLDHYGTHIIVTMDDKAKCNPYRIYRKWFSLDDCGWHKTLVEKYADLNSVIYWLFSNKEHFDKLCR